MEKIILTTPDELRQIIAETVRDVIRPENEQDSNPQQELPDNNAALPEYLNVEQAAKYLRLSKQTVYGFTSSRKIPFIKRAKRLLFRKSELDTWLQEGKKDSVTQIRAKLRDKAQ